LRLTPPRPGHLVADGQKFDIDVEVWANASTQQFHLNIVGVGGPPVETLYTGHISLT
jgi:hypothetical protein